MSGQKLASAFIACPSCGLPLRSRAAVCPNCGTLPALERLTPRLLGWVERRSRSWRPRADHLTLIVWALALAPCLIVPPILAIVFAWRDGAGASGRRGDATFVTIVACINIVISLVLIVRFENEVIAAFYEWRRPWQPGPPVGQPHLTPV